MAHQLSAAEMKRTGGRLHGGSRDRPKEGTTIRQLYDLLWERRGRVVEVPEGFAWSGQSVNRTSHGMEYLRRTYGLDIRKMPGRGRWCLAGEYVGVAYLDYVAEASDAH